MMKLYTRRQDIRQQGVALLEVVIALFVLGFGLVALAMFGNGLFAESGLVKAETEALQLAQQEIEQLREDAASSGLATISGDGGSSVTGVNAEYTLVSTLDFKPDVTDPEHATVNVVVSWTDKQDNQSVSLNSFIAASDADALGGLVAGGLEGGGLVDSPDGSATYGEDGEFVDPNTVTDVSGDNGIPEGTKLYQDGDEYILTNEEYGVLLRNSSENFSQVTGRIYIDAAMSINESVVQVVPSDTGVCRKTLAPVTDADTGEVSYITELNEVHYDGSGLVYNPDAAGTQLYTYFTYTCYFGSGWYGNIGVLRSDNANSNDRFCGGDPLVSDDGTDYSRHPQLMATRTYRGYTPQVDSHDIDNDGDLFEPAVDADGNRLYLSAGMATNALYGETSNSSEDTYTHDFLLTQITGTVVDSDCLAGLEASGHDAVLAGNNTEFANNTGYFVCVLDSSGESNCPDVLPQDLGAQVVATPSTVAGTITAGESITTEELATLTLTTSQAEECTINQDPVSGAITWSCAVYMAGSSWSGSVALASSGLDICSVDSYNLIDISGDVSGYDFSVARNCAGGVSQYTVTGVVENTSQNTALDLTGYYVVTVSAGGSPATCSSGLGVLSGISDGNYIAEFSCVVDANFNGHISLNAIPGGHRITSYPEFSSTPVTSDLTGQAIQVR